MFQLRNPQLYMIGAYIHLDEETSHLHLNFVPWVSGCKRGLETKTSLKAALATRGFASEGKGNTEWKQWAEAEKDDIALIMRRYGIDWKKKNMHNPHLSGHTALEQLQKRRGHGVLLAARQHRVLQNVEHTGVVGGEGAEADAERLVGILVLHQQDSGPAHIMLQNRQHTVLLRAVLAAHQRITGIVHVDIVETGTTLRENGLRVVTEFMPISARFIANKASYQFKHNEMDAMLEALRKTLQEETK